MVAHIFIPCIFLIKISKGIWISSNEKSWVVKFLYNRLESLLVITLSLRFSVKVLTMSDKIVAHTCCTQVTKIYFLLNCNVKRKNSASTVRIFLKQLLDVWQWQKSFFLWNHNFIIIFPTKSNGRDFLSHLPYETDTRLFELHFLFLDFHPRESNRTED